MINITICYASPNRQIMIPLQVEESCTVAMAIKRSAILDEFPEITFADMAVGIFGQRVKLDANMQEGDRIEIYRPLLIDPKEARRRNVK